MAKGRTTVFFCQSCGYESPKWMGQCPGCREWNTFVEETVEKKSAVRAPREKAAAGPVCLSSIDTKEEDRISTGMEELNRVLGGGIVRGSLVLVGGDPGIGKSTLLLQVCQKLAAEKHEVLYISGEESLKQIKLRAARIGNFSDRLRLFCETNLDLISETIRRERPEAVIIDSIQTMYNEDVSSAPGSISQVRESTAVLMQLAKGLGISIFIVGHVTKEGTVAGPRVLEHMVDTVLYFEGDRHASYRILRAVKNRFGSTNEIGVFEMRETGLAEVENPSEFMLNGRPEVGIRFCSCLFDGGNAPGAFGDTGSRMQKRACDAEKDGGWYGKQQSKPSSGCSGKASEPSSVKQRRLCEYCGRYPYQRTGCGFWELCRRRIELQRQGDRR